MLHKRDINTDKFISRKELDNAIAILEDAQKEYAIWYSPIELSYYCLACLCLLSLACYAANNQEKVFNSTSPLMSISGQFNLLCKASLMLTPITLLSALCLTPMLIAEEPVSIKRRYSDLAELKSEDIQAVNRILTKLAKGDVTNIPTALAILQQAKNTMFPGINLFSKFQYQTKKIPAGLYREMKLQLKN